MFRCPKTITVAARRKEGRKGREGGRNARRKKERQGKEGRKELRKGARKKARNWEERKKWRNK